MVVAVVAVGVVQVAVHQVIHVVAVRDGFVAAAWPVHVAGVVAAAAVLGRAGVGVLIVNVDLVFHNCAIGLLVVQMAVMQVVHMISVFDRRVSAIGPVFVIVVGMNVF